MSTWDNRFLKEIRSGPYYRVNQEDPQGLPNLSGESVLSGGWGFVESHWCRKPVGWGASKYLTKGVICLNNRLMGLFSIFLGSFRSPRRSRSRLDAAPLSPRRLERRRVLDASGLGLLIGPAGAAGEFVQVGETYSQAEDSGDAAEAVAPALGNVPPHTIQFLDPTTAEIDENRVARLVFQFEDPDLADTHTVEIDWGDGTVDSMTLPVGERLVDTSHRYFDDMPSGPTEVPYFVTVKITDSTNNFASAATRILVQNTEPTLGLVSIATVDEGGLAQLEIVFADQGVRDTHTVEIDWGDGSSDTLSLLNGERYFVTTHQYLDDMPTGPAEDPYAIDIKITDDDGGVATYKTSVLVENVAPLNIVIAPVEMINEGDYAQLHFTFDDPGTPDTHEVEIDWGDGAVNTILLQNGEREVWASHQYLDDMPNGPLELPYAINIKIADDDGAVAYAKTSVQVKNVATKVGLAPMVMINEDGEAQLRMIIADPGLLDVQTVMIDWGDGSSETIAVPMGEWFVMASHKYLDDMPTGPTELAYAINVKVTDDDGGVGTASTSVLVKNVAPSNIQISPVAMIDENSFAQLHLTFDDPGSVDTHSIEINWGDGTIQTIAVPAGERMLLANHQYLDDTPTGPAEVAYAINVKLTDDDGGFATASTSVLVKNVAPSNIQISPVAMIDENSFAQLHLTFDDPGTVDTHSVEINWGDGTIQTIAVPAGERMLFANHQYLDDSPTGPAELAYAINVKVTDDDGGFATASTSVLVKNVAPSNIVIEPVTPIDEDGNAYLEFTFDDPGSVDTHTVMIDWGDGHVDTISLLSGERQVMTTHQYIDDMPTGPPEINYEINIKVTDDDGGMDTAQTSVLTKNVAPSNIQIDPVAMINENSFAQLRFTFEDPGTLDTHTAEIDWGDGTVDTIMLMVGAREVVTSHQYLDDSPTGPFEVPYTINVKVTDDDGGFANAATSVLVKNVAPTIDSVDLTKLQINEGNLVTVSGTYSDTSLHDTHVVMVQWGDGFSEVATFTNVNGAGTFDATHFYADNDTVNPDDGPVPDNLYTVVVTVVDDDGGVGTGAIDLTVLNINPTLDPILEATDVNSDGETFLTIRFSDPGADVLTIYVDWGDVRDPSDPSMRALEPFVIDLTGVQGAGTFTVTLKHVYSGPPDPASPASDIDIYVYVGDDDLDDAVLAQGQSEIRMATIKNPGIGDQPVYIDTTPQIPRLVFPSRAQNFYFVVTTSDEGVLQSAGLQAAAGDTQVSTERFFELVVVEADGTVSKRFRLKADVLNNLPGLFRKLPDKHYEIYLVHTETNTRRLVIAVDVRGGKMIDPGDDSDGTRDRPPTNEVFNQPEDETTEPGAPQEQEIEELRDPQALPADDQNTFLPDERTRLRATGGRSLPNWGVVAVGLAATKSYQTWAQQVDRSVAEANRQKWKMLKHRNPSSRKKD